MKQKLITRFACATALCLALLTAGCSSFTHEWEKAALRKPSHDLSGRWEGHWISASNGHDGALRAVIAPDGANKYHALFHATFASAFTFTYPVTFEARQRGARIDFSGVAKLPSWAGGRYTSIGHATRTDFIATYKSKYDDGRFEMKRVEPQPIPSY